MIKIDSKTHTLSINDIYLKEVKQIAGKPISESLRGLLPKMKRRVISQPTTDTGGVSKILWLDSGSSLQVVDMVSFKQSEIPSFWNYIETKCLGVFVTSTPDFKRFAGIGLSPNLLETLHVYDVAGGTGFASASISQLFKSRRSAHPVKSVRSIEFSSKGTVIFVAGGEPTLPDTASIPSQSCASVAAVKFSSNMKVISEYQLPGSSSPALCLKRHEQGNMLFVGLVSKLVVLFFDGTVFETLAEYADLGCGPISCLQLVQDELFCLGDLSPHLLKISYSQPATGVPLQTDVKSTKIDKLVVAQFGVGSKKLHTQPVQVTDWHVTSSRQLYCTQEGLYLHKGPLKDASLEGKEGRQLLCQETCGMLVCRDRVLVVTPQNLKVVDHTGDNLAQFSYQSDAEGVMNSSEPLVSGCRGSYTQEATVYPYLISPGVLGIFDLDRMEYDRVSIWNSKLPRKLTHIHLASNGAKLFCLSSPANSSGQKWMTFWQKTNLLMPSTRPLEYLSDKVADVIAVESTLDEGMVLLAIKTLDAKCAVVAASFDGFFDCVTWYDKFESPQLLSLGRVPKSDFFFVGGIDKIHILLLQSKSLLVEVSTIKDLKTGPIRRLDLVSSTMLCALNQDGSKIASLHFAKSLEKLVF